MRLSDYDTSLLEGDRGPALQMAMAIVRDMGEIFGAPSLMDIAQVHLDTTVYMVDAGVEFAERFAELGGKFAVPTSLNASAIDHIRWKEYHVGPELLEKCRRLEQAYLTMGAIPAWTCAPYQSGNAPRFGQQIAWGESNAIAFANSVIGARTHRYGDLMDICVALTGRAPVHGLHLTESRRAELIVDYSGLPDTWLQNPAVYPLLGFILGELAGDRVSASLGIPPAVSTDSLKAFSAAAASSGAVGLFHIVGVTPEATTLEACCQGHIPEERHTVTETMVRNAEERLNTATDDRLDLVTVGCPHFSAEEFIRLAKAMEGKKVHPDVAFWVFTSRAVYGWMENSPLLPALQEAGVLVFTDGCPLQYPKDGWDLSAAMTDSGKFANYCFSQTGLPVTIGSLEECAEAAATGRIPARTAGLGGAWR